MFFTKLQDFDFHSKTHYVDPDEGHEFDLELWYHHFDDGCVAIEKQIENGKTYWWVRCFAPGYNPGYELTCNAMNPLEAEVHLYESKNLDMALRTASLFVKPMPFSGQTMLSRFVKRHLEETYPSELEFLAHFDNIKKLNKCFEI